MVKEWKKGQHRETADEKQIRIDTNYQMLALPYKMVDKAFQEYCEYVNDYISGVDKQTAKILLSQLIEIRKSQTNINVIMCLDYAISLLYRK